MLVAFRRPPDTLLKKSNVPTAGLATTLEEVEHAVSGNNVSGGSTCGSTYD